MSSDVKAKATKGAPKIGPRFFSCIGYYCPRRVIEADTEHEARALYKERFQLHPDQPDKGIDVKEISEG